MDAVWIFREKIVMFSRSPHNLKFDLSLRSQDENGEKNVAKCKKHVQGVQSYCFCTLNMQIYGALVAVVLGLRSLLSFTVHGVVVEVDDYLTSPPHPLFVGKHALKA